MRQNHHRKHQPTSIYAVCLPSMLSVLLSGVTNIFIRISMKAFDIIQDSLYLSSFTKFIAIVELFGMFNF